MEDKLDLKLEALIAEIVELQGAIHALTYYIQELVRWPSSDSILITGADIVATVGLRTVGVCKCVRFGGYFHAPGVSMFLYA